MLVLSEGFLKQWQKPDRPAVDRGMVNHHAAFFHYFFKVSIAQGIGSVPADANQNHVDRKSHPFDIQHSCPLVIQRWQFTRRPGPSCLMRQNRPIPVAVVEWSFLSGVPVAGHKDAA
jgi:hypothetical protein